MGDVRYIIPAPADTTFEPVDEVPVELARSRRVQGRLFEKHILNYGPLIHPKTGAKIDINDDFVASMQENFARGVCDIVQVPLANDDNKHVETPAANLGEVVGIRSRDSKVYALIDARQDAEKFGKTYLGASAFLSTNYTDSSTGKKAGPTLLHVAVTNRPYVTGLEDYREVLAATADNTGEVVVLSPAPEEPAVPTKDELLAALKADHGIDVEALQAAASQPPASSDSAALASSLVDALKQAGVVPLSATSDGQLSQADVVNAVVELASTVRTQDDSIRKLQRERAEGIVDGYIEAGRLLPKSRTRAVEVLLTRPDELEDFLAPVNAPYVVLGAQNGVNGPDGEGQREHDIDAEVARLTAEHPEIFPANGSGRK
jgi:hypothetical protein